MRKETRSRFIPSLIVLIALLAVIVPAAPGVAAPEAPIVPMQVRWACRPPAIDGAAPHHEWASAPWIGFAHGRAYFLNDGDYLYVLFDVVDDTAADPPLPDPPWGDYFFLTFDVNRDGAITPGVDLNYDILPRLPYDLVYSHYIGPAAWTPSSPSAGLLGVGMEPSFAAPGPHRTWEMAIPLREIGAGPGSLVQIGLRAFSQNPPFSDNVPPDFVLDFSNLVPLVLAEEACTIELRKRAMPPVVNPGDVLTYQIDYNTGNGGPYTDVVIQDAVPAGTTYLPGSAVPPAAYAGGVLTWHLGNLPPGAVGSVRFQVLVNHNICRKQRLVTNFVSLHAAQPPVHIYEGPVITDVICRPIEFPTDKPPYAESEITVRPYPLVVSQVTHLCTTISNPSPNPQTVQVTFSLANFGIGLPFTPLPAPGNPRIVTIPPGGSVTVCVQWVPTTPGHQCIQVRVDDLTGQFPPLFSQRNLDVDEVLVPGQTSVFQVPVHNDLGAPILVTMVVRNHCPGWIVELTPTSFTLPPDVTMPVEVKVTPPLGPPLGSGCTIDIEAWEMDPTGALLRLIGGIRKIDEPLIPLGDPGERPFAEREIRVTPYPLVVGQPAEVCVLLANNTGAPQQVTVDFMLSGFGIGLLFNEIVPVVGTNPQTVVIPPHSTVDVCLTFLPDSPGHHCLAIKLTMANGYVAWSYRNLDVAERLTPGVPTDVPVSIANPTPVVADIDLVVDNTCPGWTAVVNPAVLPAVGPNSTDVRTAVLTVTPPAVDLLGSGCHIDLLAYIGDRLIGGIRKIDRPPSAPPIDEPHWAEREITVSPDPPMPGLPAILCVTLVNPTAVPQTVDVTFAVADFGAGIGFTNVPPTLIGVVIPAGGAVTRCINWTPAPGGTLHRCVRVQIHQDGYRDVFSQRNIDLVRFPIGVIRVPGGQVDLPPFRLRNPSPEPMSFFLDVRPVGLAGIDIQVIDALTGGVWPPGEERVLVGHEERVFFLRLMAAGKSAAPDLVGDRHYIDVVPYGNGQPVLIDDTMSGVRYVLQLPRVYLPMVMRKR